MQQHDEEAENFNIISNTTEMSARAHIDLSQNIRNLLESPLNDFVNDQENIKAFVSLTVVIERLFFPYTNTE